MSTKACSRNLWIGIILPLPIASSFDSPAQPTQLPVGSKPVTHPADKGRFPSNDDGGDGDASGFRISSQRTENSCSAAGALRLSQSDQEGRCNYRCTDCEQPYRLAALLFSVFFVVLAPVCCHASLFQIEVFGKRMCFLKCLLSP